MTYLTRQQRTSFSVSVSTSTLTTTSTAATDNYASQTHRYDISSSVKNPGPLGPTEVSAPPTFHPSVPPNMKNVLWGAFFMFGVFPTFPNPRNTSWKCVAWVAHVLNLTNSS